METNEAINKQDASYYKNLFTVKFLRILISFLYYSRIIHNKAMINLIARLMFIFGKKDRNKSLRNITIALEVDEDEAKTIYMESLKNAIENFLIFTYIMTGLIKNEYFKHNVIINGKETLDNVLKGGNGVIAVSGHIGNFPLMVLALSLSGYPVAVIFKEFKYFGGNTYADEMKRYNVEPIAYKNNDIDVTKKIITALKKGKIVFFIIDQRGNNYIKVKLFDQELPVFPGAAVLAKRKKVDVIPIFTHYTGGKHCVDILEPLDLKRNASIEENMQTMISTIEKYVKEHPTNWLWFYYNFS